jgi:transcriptional regulator with XRE-family HTH domain
MSRTFLFFIEKIFSCYIIGMEAIRMTEAMTFAKNLLYYMAINDKVQNDLIVDLGINKSTISTWCNGKKYPRHSAIRKLADYFNVEMSDLTDEKSEYTKSTRQEAEQMFNALPEDKRKQALDYLRFLAMNEDTKL